jgi:hypothetical protein
VLYSEGDAIGFVGDDRAHFGPAEFARRYQVPPRTAGGIAAGRRPGPVSIRQVLHVVDTGDQLEQRSCSINGRSVSKPNAIHCWANWRETAKKARQRKRSRKLD